MIWRGRRAMTCGARPSSTCWTSFQTRRRGTTIVIGICIGGGGYTSGRRRCSSGRRCVSSLRLGGAGFLSGRRRLPNCCSVQSPSCSMAYILCPESPTSGASWGSGTLKPRSTNAVYATLQSWRSDRGAGSVALGCIGASARRAPLAEGVSAAFPGPNPAGRYRRGE